MRRKSTRKANKEPKQEALHPIKAIDTPMRKVCYRCGREITHRVHRLIYDSQYGVMTVCEVCWAASLRQKRRLS